MHNQTLDFLRGIAIIGVVLFHIWPKNFNSGYLGVDLFFVLSGFLIASNLDKNSSGINFLRNRFIRIGPLYFLTILFTLIAGITLKVNWVDRSDAICSILAISSICYYQKNEYFNLFQNNDPLGHLWSISLEIQFYVISYLLIKYSKKLLILILFISLFICIYKYKNDINNYYDISTRLWEYLAGSAVYIYFKNHNFKNISYGKLFAGSIFIIYIFIFTIDIKQNVYLSIGFIVVTIAIISIFKTHQLKSDFLEKISQISYASYLVHYPIIKYFNYFINNVYINFLSLIATFSIGYFLTIIYNKYISNFNNKFKYSLIISIVFISSSVYIILNNKTVNFQNIPAIQKEIKEKLGHLKCSDGTYYDCYQSDANENDYLIIGDSHAMAIGVGALLNYSENKTRFKVISRGGCLPIVEYSFWNGNPDTKPRECEKFYNIVKNELSGNYKYIVFANYNSLFLNNWIAYENKNNKYIPVNSVILNEKIGNRYLEIFKEIKSAGKTPVYILDVPEFNINLKDCATEGNKCKSLRGDTELSRLDELRINDLLKKEKFKSINLLDLLCDDKYCYAYKDGEWRYADGNHLNGTWGGLAFDYIYRNIK